MPSSLDKVAHESVVDPAYGPPPPDMYWAADEWGVVRNLRRAYPDLPEPYRPPDWMLASVISGAWAGRDVGPYFKLGLWAVCELGIDKYGNHGWCAARLSNLQFWERVHSVGTTPEGVAYSTPCIPAVDAPIYDDGGNEIPFALAVD